MTMTTTRTRTTTTTISTSTPSRNASSSRSTPASLRAPRRVASPLQVAQLPGPQPVAPADQSVRRSGLCRPHTHSVRLHSPGAVRPRHLRQRDDWLRQDRRIRAAHDRPAAVSFPARRRHSLPDLVPDSRAGRADALDDREAGAVHGRARRGDCGWAQPQGAGDDAALAAGHSRRDAGEADRPRQEHKERGAGGPAGR